MVRCTVQVLGMELGIVLELVCQVSQGMAYPRALCSVWVHEPGMACRREQGRAVERVFPLCFPQLLEPVVGKVPELVW